MADRTRPRTPTAAAAGSFASTVPAPPARGAASAGTRPVSRTWAPEGRAPLARAGQVDEPAPDFAPAEAAAPVAGSIRRAGGEAAEPGDSMRSPRWSYRRELRRSPGRRAVPPNLGNLRRPRSSALLSPAASRLWRGRPRGGPKVGRRARPPFPAAEQAGGQPAAPSAETGRASQGTSAGVPVGQAAAPAAPGAAAGAASTLPQPLSRTQPASPAVEAAPAARQPLAQGLGRSTGPAEPPGSSAGPLAGSPGATAPAPGTPPPAAAPAAGGIARESQTDDGAQRLERPAGSERGIREPGPDRGRPCRRARPDAGRGAGGFCEPARTGGRPGRDRWIALVRAGRKSPRLE